MDSYCILYASEEKGLLPPMIVYLKIIYAQSNCTWVEDCKVTIQYKVQQGDPISLFLFNDVLD